MIITARTVPIYGQDGSMREGEIAIQEETCETHIG